MKRIMCIFLCVLPFLIVSCSNPVGISNKDLTVLVENSALKISNHSTQKVYYFTVEQNAAAKINWVAGFNGPYISVGQTAEVQFDKIYSDNQPIRKGDKVILYYWSKPEPGNDLVIKNLLVVI